MKKIKVAQFGLGPIGVESLRLAASKPWADIVGAVDIDPAKVGRQLSEVTGLRSLRGRIVHGSLGELLGTETPEVIFHTAVSRFKAAFEQLEPMARKGINVVSSCEELVFPQLREPALARRLDQICRKKGARIVGTGVNPGFVMDLLPMCLTGVSLEVRAVHIQRVVDAATRREPLQRKIGSGLPPRDFQRLLKEGKAGHAGLKESLALLAHCLGWKVKAIRESGEPVVADHDIRTNFLKVKKGHTCGLHQRAEARIGRAIVISLDLQMYLDAPNPHDAIQIEGRPPLSLVMPGGVAGDDATVAALVNTAPRLLTAQPGLILITDLAVPRIV
jgi:4-hydroxy-tetrahydrodipicolinate reductase